MPAYPGCPGKKAIRRMRVSVNCANIVSIFSWDDEDPEMDKSYQGDRRLNLWIPVSCFPHVGGYLLWQRAVDYTTVKSVDAVKRKLWTRDGHVDVVESRKSPNHDFIHSSQQGCAEVMRLEEWRLILKCVIVNVWEVILYCTPCVIFCLILF